MGYWSVLYTRLPLHIRYLLLSKERSCSRIPGKESYERLSPFILWSGRGHASCAPGSFYHWMAPFDFQPVFQIWVEIIALTPIWLHNNIVWPCGAVMSGYGNGSCFHMKVFLGWGRESNHQQLRGLSILHSWLFSAIPHPTSLASFQRYTVQTKLNSAIGRNTIILQ